MLRHERLTVLALEDVEADAELLAEVLGDALPRADLRTARTLGEAEAVLAAERVDVALVDLSVPDAEGLAVVHRLRAVDADLPLLVLTGNESYETAAAALTAGAQDYLHKADLTGSALRRAVRYALDRAGAERAVRTAQGWATSVLDALDAPTCAVGTTGHVTASNEAFDRLVEQLPDLPDPLPYDLACRAGLGLNPADVSLLDEGLRAVLTGSRPRFEHDAQVEAPPGTAVERWYSVRVSPLAGGRGAVVTHVDVTALKAAHEELRQAALHDGLTALPNRVLLVDRLEQALSSGAPAGGRTAVAVVALDGLGRVNDTLGYAAGDALLVEVAVRLCDAVGLGDTVARLGGDQFAVVTAVDGATPASALAARLQAAAARPLELAGRTTVPSVCVGLVLADGSARAEGLLSAAEGALQQAKHAGPGSVHSTCLDDLADQRTRLADAAAFEQRLRAAITGRSGPGSGLEVHFQPVVRVADGRPVAVEALARWRDGERGLLPPGSFIATAERTGLVVPLGARVVEAACAQVASWTGSRAGLSVAVNLSARQLSHPRLVAVVEEVLRSTGLAPGRLVLEMTESAVVDDAGAALRAMRGLKDLGVRIAIDDFGTGYSSFLYLKRYPLDEIKVDRSFVSGLPDEPDDSAIVASILRLAEDIGVDVVAEGVEEEEQRAALQALGCRYAQGFLFSRPVPAGDLDDVLTRLEERADTAGERAAAPAVVLPRWTGGRAATPEVQERIRELSARGASLHTIAAALNGEGIPAPSGRRWHPRSVARWIEPAPASAAVPGSG